MKEEYISPQLQLIMFRPAQQVAALTEEDLTEEELMALSDHDNGYIDWYAMQEQ